MTINIQNLVKELISYTHIQTSTISSEAKSVLSQMSEEFKRLAASNDSDKQAKMIELFIGGTILALRQDDCKYNYSFELYPETLAEEVFKTVQKDDTLIEAMYKVGKQALLHLPNAFNGNIFKTEGMLINTQEPIPFFPQLKKNADKINLLVKFCVKYAENLNQSEVEKDELGLVELQLSDVILDTPTISRESKASQSPTLAPSTPFSNTSMQILGGFIAALGVAAIATAFVALNAATLGIAGLVVAGFGVAALLGGVGLFAAGTYKKHQSTADLVIDDSLASVPM